MIRDLPPAIRMTARQRHHARWLAARRWHSRFVPFAFLNVEGFGRVMVVWQRLETRRSDKEARRLWRVPGMTDARSIASPKRMAG